MLWSVPSLSPTGDSWTVFALASKESLLPLRELPCLFPFRAGHPAQVNGDGVVTAKANIVRLVDELSSLGEDGLCAGQCQKETPVVRLAQEAFELADVLKHNADVASVPAIFEFDRNEGPIIAVALFPEIRIPTLAQERSVEDHHVNEDGTASVIVERRVLCLHGYGVRLLAQGAPHQTTKMHLESILRKEHHSSGGSFDR
jgi:hypothetical protein